MCCLPLQKAAQLTQLQACLGHKCYLRCSSVAVGFATLQTTRCSLRVLWEDAVSWILNSDLRCSSAAIGLHDATRPRCSLRLSTRTQSRL
jgi:hypothetical protein